MYKKGVAHLKIVQNVLQQTQSILWRATHVYGAIKAKNKPAEEHVIGIEVSDNKGLQA